MHPDTCKELDFRAFRVPCRCTVQEPSHRPKTSCFSSNLSHLIEASSKTGNFPYVHALPYSFCWHGGIDSFTPKSSWASSFLLRLAEEMSTANQAAIHGIDRESSTRIVKDCRLLLPQGTNEDFLMSARGWLRDFRECVPASRPIASKHTKQRTTAQRLVITFEQTPAWLCLPHALTSFGQSRMSNFYKTHSELFCLLFFC